MNRPILLIVSFLILFIGCPNQTDKRDCDELIFSRGPGVLELNDSLYSYYASLSSEISIISANIAQDTLYVRINFLGGGIKHEFELIGQEILVGDTPPSLQVILHQENNGDECTKEITEDLKFDISSIRSISIYSPLVEIRLLGNDGIYQWCSSNDTLSLHGNELIPTSIGNYWIYYKSTWLVENDSLVGLRVDTVRLVDTFSTLGHLWYQTNWYAIPGLGSMFTNSNDTVYSLEIAWGAYKDAKFINPYNDTISYECSHSDYGLWLRRAEPFNGYYNHNLGVFKGCIKYVDDDLSEIILYPGVGVLYEIIPSSQIYPFPEKRYEKILIDYHIE